jgi:hypothetical protein
VVWSAFAADCKTPAFITLAIGLIQSAAKVGVAANELDGQHDTSVTPKKGPLRLIVLYTCINLRGMIFMGFPSYFGTKTAAGTTIGKYFMGQT